MDDSQLQTLLAALSQQQLKAADDKGAITVGALTKIVAGVFGFLVTVVPAVIWLVTTMSNFTEHNVVVDNRIKTVEEKIHDLSLLPANYTRQDQRITDVEKSVVRIETAQAEIVAAIRSQDSMLRTISSEIGKLAGKP